MKWFDNWFKNMMRRNWGNNHPDDQDAVPKGYSVSAPINKYYGLDSNKRVDFAVFKADGGYVIQYMNNDVSLGTINNSTGHDRYKLHVVTSDENLGETINKIILLEAIYK